ncbi:MAG TPA: DeoR/GlpR family DNA-binding transcription regulator [Tepidisphaeraceae bacterium]|jgi:DeoR/GlpR family transcriptional regulator of sugar metabolism
MLSAERKRLIVESIGRDGRVVAAELSRRFDVSEDTIRRDLRELAAEGLVHRVHGGALPLSLPKAPVVESYAARAEQAPAAKAAIARAAARMIRTGQVISIDGGTTPLQVAQQLAPGLRITVITHSLPVLTALAGREGIEMIAVGGRFMGETLVSVGPTAVEAYRGVRPDVCILGVAGVDVDAGLTALNQPEAQVKRAMAENAAQVVAVAAAEKLGTAGPFLAVPIERITHLVTDKAAAARALRPFKEAGLQVITA